MFTFEAPAMILEQVGRFSGDCKLTDATLAPMLLNPVESNIDSEGAV